MASFNVHACAFNVWARASRLRTGFGCQVRPVESRRECDGAVGEHEEQDEGAEHVRVELSCRRVPKRHSGQGDPRGRHTLNSRHLARILCLEGGYS